MVDPVAVLVGLEDGESACLEHGADGAEFLDAGELLLARQVVADVVVVEGGVVVHGVGFRLGGLGDMGGLDRVTLFLVC